MVKFVIAKQLVGMRVVTTDGFDVGRFVDADVSEVTGKINFIMIEPNLDSQLANRLKGDKGELRIPYSAVTSVNDFIMVDRRNIQH